MSFVSIEGLAGGGGGKHHHHHGGGGRRWRGGYGMPYPVYQPQPTVYYVQQEKAAEPADNTWKMIAIGAGVLAAVGLVVALVRK